MDCLARETTHSDGRSGVDGYARLRVLTLGGTVAAYGEQILVEGGGAVTVLIAIGTTWEGADPDAAAGNKSGRRPPFPTRSCAPTTGRPPALFPAGQPSTLALRRIPTGRSIAGWRPPGPEKTTRHCARWSSSLAATS